MAANNQLNQSTVPLPVPKGGFGVDSHVPYTPLIGGTTSTGPVQSVASLGSQDYNLQSTGAGSPPQFLPSDWQFLVKQQANAVASANFINLSTDYIAYKFIFSYINPATDGVNLIARVSTDNGSTWLSGASDYIARWSVFDSAFTNGDATTDFIVLTTVVGNTNFTEYSAGELLVYYPADSGSHTTMTGRFMNVTSSGVQQSYVIMGQRLNNEANNAVQFFFSSGNMASVDICMYGMVRT